MLVLLLALAQFNATSDLLTYGDVLGAPCEAVVGGGAPSTPTFVMFSQVPGANNFLVNQTGDPNDQLQIGLELALQGFYLSGVADAAGGFRASVNLPLNPAYLDRTVYWQAFARPGGGGAAEYDRFSNLRTMNLSQADRWQSSGPNSAPFATANLAWAVDEVGGENGGALRTFVCGGGPALLTDELTPYATSNRAWWLETAGQSHTVIAGAMATGRAFHSAVRLQDGRFLVCGGVNGPWGANPNYYTKVLNSAEIFDPATGAFSAAANMLEYRAGASATLLPDGRVLVAGGTEGNGAHELHDVADILGTAHKTTEIYNPATNAWSNGPAMPEFKAGALDVRLADGRWLVAGGITHTLVFGIPIPDFSDNVSIYDPATGAWTNKGAVLRAKRALGGIALLPTGHVYMAGGAGGDIFNVGPITATEVYNPATNSSVTKPALTEPAAFSRCVLLPDDRVLVVGGAKGDLDDPLPIATCWLYSPVSSTLTLAAAMPEARAGGVVEFLEDGTVYAGGGESNSGTATDLSRSYTP